MLEGIAEKYVNNFDFILTIHEWLSILQNSQYLFFKIIIINKISYVYFLNTFSRTSWDLITITASKVGGKIYAGKGLGIWSED